jgi:hypothetical protein
MREYRVHPESPTRVAMRVDSNGPRGHGWVDLVRGRYLADAEVKDWTPLVPADAEHSPGVPSHAYPTITPHEGVPSDQGRNQTPLTPSESTGDDERSNECTAGDHKKCPGRFYTDCDCKCHAIRAAYSG